MAKKDITLERVVALLAYDGVAGEIRRRTQPGQPLATGIVHQKKAKPWLYVSIDGGNHAASKIAWMLAHKEVPSHPVRFVNGDTTDVRLANLALDVPPPSVLTPDEVCRRFDYDEASGLLRLRLPTRKSPAGVVVGYRPGKYGSIGIGKRHYLAHVLVWMHQHGEIPKGMVIDHINGKKDDNRLCNLRLATQSQNRANWQTPRSNASGARGIVQCKRDGRWRVEMRHNGKRIFVGRFDTIDEATSARRRKEIELWGEFAKPDIESGTHAAA